MTDPCIQESTIGSMEAQIAYLKMDISEVKQDVKTLNNVIMRWEGSLNTIKLICGSTLAITFLKLLYEAFKL